MEANRLRNGYAPLGGIAIAAERFKSGDLSLRQISTIVGWSHESVRSDLIQYLGLPVYTKLLRDRLVQAKQQSQPIELNITSARKLLAKRVANLAGKAADEARILLKVLGQAEEHKIKIRVIISERGPLKFLLEDRRSIKIKVARPRGLQRANCFGLHRFSITPAISSYEFAIFSAEDEQGGGIYIFKTSEICGIWSLILRYKWFDRKTKYSFALNRWSILKTQAGDGTKCGLLKKGKNT